MILQLRAVACDVIGLAVGAECVAVTRLAQASLDCLRTRACARAAALRARGRS
jgi:hypothetical protein